MEEGKIKIIEIPQGMFIKYDDDNLRAVFSLWERTLGWTFEERLSTFKKAVEPSGGQVFKFGKYKGLKVSDVIEANVSYVRWCLENVKGFELDGSLEEKYRVHLRELEDATNGAFNEYDYY